MWTRILASCVAAGVAMNSVAVADTDTKPAQFEIQLLKGMPNDTPLVLCVDWRGGFSGGFALARAYNKALHDVDLSGLVYDAGAQAITGTVRVTVNPDDYVPADRKPAACRYALDAKVKAGVVAGTYDGVHGAATRKGVVEGKVLETTPDEGVYRLLLLHGMARLNQIGGMNKGYALDMRLRFQFEGGTASHAIFENVVPDYRRYCAVVESLGVSRQDAAFKATMVAVLDYGRGAKPSKDGAPESRFETNTYVLTGFRIGDRVAGRFTATAEGLNATDFFVGDVDREPPPAPAGSKAFLRLHGAMRDDGPIILNLGLANDGCINGYAWASGYNHQPHAVDASKLRLEGNRLSGEVVVTMWPDCYKPVEDVVIRHTLDVTFDKGIASGRFKGKDNDEPFEGIVTGELTRGKPPAVTMETFGACELSLNSGVKGGHAQMNITFKDGKATALSVKYPQWKDPYEARLDACDLKVEGDRFSGTVVVAVKGKDGKEGRFSYVLDAIVDDDEITGLWHGMADGKHILNKSSKLYGKMAVAPKIAP